MKLQLDSAGKELIDLQIKRQELQSALQESNLQLEMLREVEYETQRRNEIYAEFVERLQDIRAVWVDGVSIEREPVTN